MSSSRRIAALPIVGAALVLVVFGVVRGTSLTGPAHGTRLEVAIQPPVDDAARTMALHVVRERLDEKGVDVHVVPADDQLVVELSGEDSELVARQAEILERTGKLEVRRVASSPWLASVGAYATANPPSASSGIRVDQGIVGADDRWEKLPVAEANAIGCTGRVDNGKRNCLTRGGRLIAAYLDSIAGNPQLAVPDGHIVAYGRVANTWHPYLLDRAVSLTGAAIREIHVVAGGAEITVAESSALEQLTAGTSVAFVFDGTVRFVGAPDQVTGTKLHLATGSGDDGVDAALDLVSVVEAGAVRPLRVVRQEPFSREIGFLPRAWLFLASGAVLLLAATLLWRSAR